MIRAFFSFFLSTLLIDRAGQLRRYPGCPVPTPPIARRMGELVPDKGHGGDRKSETFQVQDSDLNIPKQRLSDFRKLVTMDGKRHYGDGLYREAERVLGIGYNELARFKRLSEVFEIRQRCLSLSFGHHYEVASLKQIKEKKGDLYKRAKDDLGGRPRKNSATDSPSFTEKQKIIEETGKQKPKENSLWKIEN